MLKARINQLEEEVGCVKWYINVMEEGIDTKEVVEQYRILRD